MHLHPRHDSSVQRRGFPSSGTQLFGWAPALRGVSPSSFSAPHPTHAILRGGSGSLSQRALFFSLPLWSGACPGSPLPDRLPSALVGPPGSGLPAGVGAFRGPCHVGDLLRCLPPSGCASSAPRSQGDRMTTLLFGVCSGRRAMEQSPPHCSRLQSRQLFLCPGTAPASSLRGPWRPCWLDVLLFAPSWLSLFSNSFRWPGGAAASL